MAKNPSRARAADADRDTDPSTTSTPMRVLILCFIAIAVAIAAGWLGMQFDVHPGDGTLAFLQPAAVVIVGVLALTLSVCLFKLHRATYTLSFVLLAFLQIVGVFMLLNFASDARLPGGGTTLGVAGIVTIIFARKVLGTLRRPTVYRHALGEAGEKSAQRPRGFGQRLLHVLWAPAVEVDVEEGHWLKENIEAIVIALIMALIIRAFAVEAFKIPTHSMLPTLVGEYMEGGVPKGGDKILVNKFIYSIREPERWDVIVFKYPLNEARNFIKRLVGLSEEQTLIYKGDIWVRPAPNGTPDERAPFKVQRMPRDVQLAMWQLNYDSRTDPDGPQIGRALDASPDYEPFWEPCRVDANNLASNRDFTSDRSAFGGDGDVDFDRPVRSFNTSDRVLHWYPRDRNSGWSARDGILVCEASGDEIHALGYARRIFDTMSLPDAPTLPPLPSDNSHIKHLVGDKRFTAQITLDTAETRWWVELRRDDETIVFEIKGDGHGSLTFDHAGRATRFERDMLEVLRERAVAIAPGKPMRFDIAVADRTAIVSIDRVELVRWEFGTDMPLDVNTLSGDVLIDESTLRFGISNGSATVGDIRIYRDEHYRAGNDRVAPVYTQGPDQFLPLGDNCPRSKDARLWYMGYLQLKPTEPGGESTLVRFEPDPPDSDLQLLDRRLGQKHRSPLTNRSYTFSGATEPSALVDSNGSAYRRFREQLDRWTDIAVVDSYGLVREFRRDQIEHVWFEPHPFITRDQLIGKAMLRFWPVSNNPDPGAPLPIYPPDHLKFID